MIRLVRKVSFKEFDKNLGCILEQKGKVAAPQIVKSLLNKCKCGLIIGLAGEKE